ncbi:hypothetical protein ACHAPJ_011365 [Fusarium lateritium]
MESTPSNWAQRAVQVTKHARRNLAAKIPTSWLLPDSLLSNIPRNVHESIETCDVLNTRELEITRASDATTIIECIKSKGWTAKEVVVAFCKRAAVAQQLTNCVMDMNFDEAIRQAEALDDHHRTTGTTDLTAVKGMNYSIGFVDWAERTSSNDAVIVQSLRKAGAVVYVKTTMPQTGMALETTSNLWGRTLNPANTRLSAGGSSGGEGVLIACRGAPLGISTDIGGSIRAPAAFNGLYGIKPTSGRCSYQGSIIPVPGQISVASAIGPVGRSIRDLGLICQVWSDDQPWTKDPNVVPMPWRPQATPAKITIGVMWHDEVVMPHPPIRRALAAVVAKLKAAGHDVIDIAPHKHDYAWEITRRLYFPTAGREHRQFLADSGEPIISSAAELLEGLKELSVPELMACNAQMREYQVQYLNHWNATASLTQSGNPIDAILMPGMASTSFPHDFYPWWGYFSVWNLLNYPAVVLPVGHVNKETDQMDEDYHPINPIDEKNFHMYDSELFDGVPISLQLVGRPLEEEKLLAIAGKIDKDAVQQVVDI